LGHSDGDSGLLRRQTARVSHEWLKLWIALRSLSSSAHSRDPLACNDGLEMRHTRSSVDKVRSAQAKMCV
jgi:hypothetical protein